jgi:hypothetical protein
MAPKENDPEPMHGKSNVRTLTDTTAASESTPNHAFIPLAFSGNDVAQAKLNLPGGATIDFDGQLDDVSLRKIIGAVITVTKHEEVS